MITETKSPPASDSPSTGQASPPKQELSVRTGVFLNLAAADQAVANLLAAGFTKDQITVISSDEARKRYFEEFEHQEPAGEHAAGAAAAGTSVGAVLGGLTAIALGAATGTVPLIIAGGAGIAAGSAAGGFLGAMLTRGGEKELSNFYDQAIRDGRILVAVEYHGPDAREKLQTAAKIIAEAGSEPLPLVEG